MNGSELALRLLPPRYLDESVRRAVQSAEELRLRLGQPLMLLRQGREHPVGGEPIGEDELMRVLEKATGASMHSAASSLARGFLSYHGLRVGVCGSVAEHGGAFVGFRHISSLAIRIPRECRGVCDALYERLRAGPQGNLLIVSPPGGGKTTALRELIRLYSSDGCRVGVADERWEIAACESGRAQFELGAHCDVISGLGKAEASMMLLRGMNPQIVAMDEITGAEDLDSVREIVGCGVHLMATAHAADFGDLRRRPLYNSLLEDKVFDFVIRIAVCEGERRYELRRMTA